MDISEAIKRLESVNGSLKRLSQHNRLDAPVWIKLETQEGHWAESVFLSAEQYREIHSQAVAKLTDERDALQAVVDAANAMLKGMGK